MTNYPRDSGQRVNARLDAEEATLLARAQAQTGKSASAIMKEALRAYCERLPKGSALDIFSRHSLVGSISGPTDLSESYKDQLNFGDKHGAP